MSALQKLKTVVPGLEDDLTTYECQNCGTQFESDSPADRVTCVDCLSGSVDTVEQ